MSQTTERLDISAEVARIHAAVYEREPEPVTTTLDDDVAVCVLRIALSPAEKLLILHRHHDAVHGQRQALEHALAPAMNAAVERATGRSVTAFLSETHFDPSITLLTFVFASAAGPATEAPIG